MILFVGPTRFTEWSDNFTCAGLFVSLLVRVFSQNLLIKFSDFLHEVRVLEMLKADKVQFYGKFIFAKIWAKRAAK